MKRVTSTDPGTIEEPENETSQPSNGDTTQNGGSNQNGGSQNSGGYVDGFDSGD